MDDNKCKVCGMPLDPTTTSQKDPQVCINCDKTEEPITPPEVSAPEATEEVKPEGLPETPETPIVTEKPQA